jgi:hypothetical protein
MYEWGNATLPVATFDGQLYVDDKGQIWQWDATGGAWRHKDDFYRTEVMSQELGVGSASTLVDPFQFIKTRDSNLWDQLYSKAFVELRWRQQAAPNTVTVQRICQVTEAELKAWMQANGPQSGGLYTADCLLRVYEVVSPEMRISRVMSMHRVYGSMRGRKSYFGDFGRSVGNADNGIYSRAGYGNKFRSYFSAANLCRDLIQDFFGQTPNPADPNDGRAMWFPNAQKSGKYRQSNGILYLPGTGMNGRMCWDVGTQTYVDAPGADTTGGQYSPDPVGVRWLYVQEPAGASIQIGKMTQSVTKGSSFVRNRLSVIVAVAVRNENNTNLKAVMLYPMGITHVTLKIPQEIGMASDIIVLNEYEGTSLSTVRAKHAGTSAENPAPNMFRFPISSIAVLIGNKKNNYKTALDDPGIPSKLSFYVRDPITGLRGALADRQIVKVMRKTNMPLCWVESPVQG